MDLVRKLRTSPKLFSSIDVTALATILIVLVVVLRVVANMSHNPHRSVSVDEPRVSHPVAMPGASREDAMMLTITRDGHAFFAYDQIDPSDLSAKIQDRLTDREVERKVYVVADMHARWGGVRMALEGMQAAGIVRVAFLADQGRMPKLSP